MMEATLNNDERAASTMTPPKEIANLVPAIALFSFKTKESSKLSFSKGDTIYVLSHHSSGWSNGIIFDPQTKRSRSGWFPHSYIASNEMPDVPPPPPPITALGDTSNRAVISVEQNAEEEVQRGEGIPLPEPLSLPQNNKNIETAAESRIGPLLNTPVSSRANPSSGSARSLLSTAVANRQKLKADVDYDADKKLQSTTPALTVQTSNLADLESATSSATEKPLISASSTGSASSTQIDTTSISLVGIASHVGMSPSAIDELVRAKKPSSWEGLVRSIVQTVTRLNETLSAKTDGETVMKEISSLSQELVLAVGKVLAFSGMISRGVESRRKRRDRTLLSLYHDLISSLKSLTDILMMKDMVINSPESCRMQAGHLLLAVRQYMGYLVDLPATPTLPSPASVSSVTSESKSGNTTTSSHDALMRELDEISIEIKQNLDQLCSVSLEQSPQDARHRHLVDRTKMIISNVTKLVALIENDNDKDEEIGMTLEDLSRQSHATTLLRQNMSSLVQAVTAASVPSAPAHTARQLVLQCNTVHENTRALIKVAKRVVPVRRDKLKKAQLKKDVMPYSPKLSAEETASAIKSKVKKDRQSQYKLRKFFGEVLTSPEPLSAADKLSKFFGETPLSPLDLPLMRPSLSVSSGSPLPRWMDYDYAVNDIIFHPETGRIKAATIDALVERLTSHEEFDSEFTQDFLFTFKRFIHPPQLVDALKRRLILSPPDGLSAQDLSRWLEHKKVPIQLRVFKTLKKWLDEYWYEPVDSESIALIEDLAENHLSQSMPKEAERILYLCRKRQAADSSAAIARVQSMHPSKIPTPIMPKYCNPSQYVRFLDLDPLEIARQMTLMESRLFMAIHPMDFLFYQPKTFKESESILKTKPLNTDAAIRQMIQHANKMTGWTAEMVLRGEDPKQRASLIKFFIKIAEKCHAMNNFATREAILAGLNSTPVFRLKATWEHLPAKYKTSFTNMMKHLDRENHFNSYRQTLKCIALPCIPFLGMYLSDITFITQGNPDTLCDGRLINFDKHSRLATIVEEIRRLQSVSHLFIPIEDTQSFITQQLSECSDVNELHDLSVKVEPREPSAPKEHLILDHSTH